MSEPRELDKLQLWMQAVITHPAGVAAGVASHEAQREIDVALDALESVVTRSQALSAEDRLGVYAGAYFARLLECLRGEFPMLLRAVGEDAFDAFCVGYLSQHPSRSYTLAQLGANFAAWLAHSRAEQPELEASGWTACVIDLARLEWAITEVFDGPGVERRSPLDAAALQAIPVAEFPALRLACAPCLRLLPFETAVNDYYSALRRDAAAPPPPAEPTWLALSRRDYVVQRYPLSQPAYTLLAALQRGETVGDAISAAAELADDLDALAAGLQAWFQQWARGGFFVQASR